MRVLLLNEYYPPDTSATAKIAAEVAETLAVRHKVTVLAGRPSYDPLEFYPWSLLRRETRNGIFVERVGSTAYSRRRMKQRVANYLSYLALALPRALAIRADVILAMTDPPVAGIVGAWVSRITGRPLVYNIRDLYPEMAVLGGIVAPSKWTDRWERMHRRALRQATRIIVLGDDMRARILAKGVPPARVVTVRDGAVPCPSPPAQDDPIIGEIRRGFPFVVLHAGNIGFYGAWDTLLKAAELLRDCGAAFVFIGDGANRAQLEHAATGSPNIRLLPFRPAEQIPHVMAAGDIHVVTVRRGLEGVVVPSKLYSILAAGRPVIAVAPAETDAARIVTQEQCGVAVDPDNPEALAAAIRALVADPHQLTRMGANAREAAAKYARVSELARFAEILEEAVRD